MEITRVNLNHYIRDNNLTQKKFAELVGHSEDVIKAVCALDEHGTRKDLVKMFDNMVGGR